jgi:nitrite reductase/ring-hydroxylating ferredoxin subunit
MDRKEFIRACGLSCLAFKGISGFLTSCAARKNLNVKVESGKLKVPRAELLKNESSGNYRRHLIVNAEGLKFPVVLYRLSDTEYSALLLQCSHQEMELNVNGDMLSCPAHGSEFNNKGAVLQGPAERPLKKFPVTTDNENIYIHIS